VSATAIVRLTAASDDPSPLATHTPVAVISWPSVPVEIIRAAGFRPFVLRGDVTATPTADAHLERDIFPSRLRHLAEAALTGRLSEAALIVIPRTSDADYKCFLYLREFVRRGVVRKLPPVLLFDLLQSAGRHVPVYDVSRTQALTDQLAAASGRAISTDDLRVEIVPVSCNDSMSGRAFPATVTVTLNGRTFRGCGEALATPFQG